MGKSKGKGQIRTSKGGSTSGRFRERGYRPDSAIQQEQEADAVDNLNHISLNDDDDDDEEESGEENAPDSSVISPAQFPVRLFMWEFGQNDPKR